MLKKIIISSCVIAILLGAQPARAVEPLTEKTPVQIVAIYPNAPGSKERGKEFVTLRNNSDLPQILTGATLRLTTSKTSFSLSGITLAAQESLTVFPSFTLPNSGGTVILEFDDTQDTVTHEVIYPAALSDTVSWALGDNNAWGEIAPKSAIRQIGPKTLPEPESPDSDPSPQPQKCTANDVVITEILADPPGSDKNGGEFVELYNPNSEPQSLAGCKLITDKLEDGFAITSPNTLASKQYISINLKDGLLNGGGTVTFVSNKTEHVVKYPTLSANESWAQISGQWQTTDRPSPGAVNVPTPPITSPAEDEESNTKTAIVPTCPEGKFRNPQTNRCKTIPTPDEAEPIACKAGQERNPATNRCRAIATVANTTLAACDAGEERNPTTNRCRKIAVIPTSASAATATPIKGTDNLATANQSSTKTNLMIIGIVAAAAIGYALFEYRKDIRHLFTRAKNALYSGRR